MTEKENVVPHNFNLETYAKVKQQMIATNDSTYGTTRNTYWGRREYFRDYSV